MAHIIMETITNDHLTYQMKYNGDAKMTIKYDLLAINITRAV